MEKGEDQYAAKRENGGREERSKDRILLVLMGQETEVGVSQKGNGESGLQ